MKEVERSTTGSEKNLLRIVGEVDIAIRVFAAAGGDGGKFRSGR
jgi:hypothetical protein